MRAVKSGGAFRPQSHQEPAVMRELEHLLDRALQQVFKFSHDGRLLMTLGTERAAGLDGAHGNKRIAKFSADGKFLLDWGRKGQGPGEFDLPHNVAVDAQGLVYVADRSN